MVCVCVCVQPEGKVLCNESDGAWCHSVAKTHTQCHREPFVVSSQLPREQALAWLENSLRCRNSHPPKLYESFGAVAADTVRGFVP